MIDLPRGFSAYLQAQLAATYMDIMEKRVPGFQADIDGAFLAADQFVQSVLPADCCDPANKSAVERAIRAQRALKLRSTLKVVRK